MKIIKHRPWLFKLKDKNGRVVPFQLNTVQKKIIAEIENQIAEKGQARLIIVKGRQQGVTTFMQLLALSYVLTTPAFNAYTMAHDATLANDIFEQKIKFAFDNLHPIIKSIFRAKRDNTRQLMFEGNLNFANITVGLSARGTTQNFLHISEAGKMSMNNKLWDEMTEGSLQAAENAQIIVIESTADGGLGRFYDMVQSSLKGESEFKTMFLDWKDSTEYAAEPPLDYDWTEKYKEKAMRYGLPVNPILSHGLNQAQLYWYYQKLNTLGAGIKSQYPLNIQQAFEQNVEGSYYQDFIDDMNAEGRFAENPAWAYNPNKGVITYWDLAVSHDLNAVLFVQTDGRWINIIDYYEKTGVGAQTIAEDLMSKGYLYDAHKAPHDVTTRQLDETALRTKQDIFRSVGLPMVRIGKTTVASGIEAVRALFPRLRVYKNPNTTLFINRIRAYRAEDTHGTGVAKEVHDINSHAADALRYLCVDIKVNDIALNTVQTAKPGVYRNLKPIHA
jgi:hypothetical protein